MRPVARVPSIALGIATLGLLTAVASPAAAAPTPEKVPTKLVEAARADGSVSVIVGLAVDTRTEGSLSKAAVGRQRQAITRAQDRLLDELGTDVEVARRFHVIPYVALRATPETLARLAVSKRVRRVYADEPAPPSLLDSVPLIGAASLHSQGVNGQGTAVAILDSGVEVGHEFFGGRVVDESCFSNNGGCPNGGTSQFGGGAAAPCLPQADGCDHGTHVAGIAAGNQGVAPGARIVAINVFSHLSGTDCGDEGGECIRTFSSDQIAGLERVFDLRTRHNIVAANMSLGGGQFFGDCDGDEAPRKAIIDQLASVNVATAIASGNDGFSDSLGSPGCISSAVTVGSTTKQDQVSEFSNSHPVVDLLAPGSDIQSSVVGGVYGFKSGTSMATPHVAGTWALLREAFPNASVSQVLSALQRSGVPVTDPRNGLTRSRIQVDAAKNTLGGGGGGGDDTTLALLGGRFEVSARWHNQFDGSTGDARALPQTDLSGYFAFTDPNNIELIVKILDFGDAIKVFYSQLTDLQFAMTVTDKLTGRTKQYGNTPGNCGAIDQSFQGANVLVIKKDAVANGDKSTCFSDDSTLCLLGGRFRLQMSWRNQFNGQTGFGGAVPLSDLTGQFYFTEPSNVEILTKVLDFGDRILFFYGALSDLQFRIEVTDTATGRVKEFDNPPGNFCGGRDTNF
jgi:subtilisin family serine protease